MGMIAAYLVLAEVVKARFYKMQSRPHEKRLPRADRHERHVRRRAARFRHDYAAVPIASRRVAAR
jgi:hypothetical protein